MDPLTVTKQLCQIWLDMYYPGIGAEVHVLYSIRGTKRQMVVRLHHVPDAALKHIVRDLGLQDCDTRIVRAHNKKP